MRRQRRVMTKLVVVVAYTPACRRPLRAVPLTTIRRPPAAAHTAIPQHAVRMVVPGIVSMSRTSWPARSTSTTAWRSWSFAGAPQTLQWSKRIASSANLSPEWKILIGPYSHIWEMPGRGALLTKEVAAQTLEPREVMAQTLEHRWAKACRGLEHGQLE